MISLKIYALLFVILGFSLLGGYTKYLYNKNEELNFENSKLQNQITNMSSDIEKIKNINYNLISVNSRLSKESSELSEKLKKLSNIDKMASKHPKMLGNIMTNGTKNVNRCFENISRNKECN